MLWSIASIFFLYVIVIYCERVLRIQAVNKYGLLNLLILIFISITSVVPSKQLPVQSRNTRKRLKRFKSLINQKKCQGILL